MSVITDFGTDAKTNPTLRYGIYAVYVAVIIGIVYVVLQIIKGAHEAAGVVGEVATDKITAVKLGIDPARVTFIRTTASNLWNKSTSRDFFKLFLGFSYATGDFESAINLLSGSAEVILLNSYYTQYGGDSLRDVITWLHGFGNISNPGVNIDATNFAIIQTLP